MLVGEEEDCFSVEMIFFEFYMIWYGFRSDHYVVMNILILSGNVVNPRLMVRSHFSKNTILLA